LYICITTYLSQLISYFIVFCLFSRRTRARGGSESNLPMSDQKANSSRPRCIPKSSQNSSRDSSFSDLSGETKITLKQATSHPSLVSM